MNEELIIGKKTSALRWVPTAYFAMGLPFVAISLVSVIMFTDLGIDKTEVAFWTSLLTLPYTLKFLWSPLLEIYGTKRKFVICTQILSGICFGLIAFTLPLADFFRYAVALLGVIALSGATHDIATDGIYLSALGQQQQSRLAGWQGAFYNLAKVLANGGLVFMAGWFVSNCAMTQTMAWMVVMGILGAMLIGLGLYHLFALPDPRSSSKRGGEGIREVFSDFIHKPHIWFYMAFILCYRLTEGLAMKIVPIFLKSPLGEGGLGLDNEQIGLIYGTLGTIAFIVGSILGGHYIARVGLDRTLLKLVGVFNFPFVIYFLLAEFQPASLWVVGSGLVAEYFCYGFGFVGLTIFMMHRVAPGRHSMAHYAIASGLMNLGVMVPGMISGWLCQQTGYLTFFMIALLMCIPSLLMAPRIVRH